jgi:phosphate transport system substrate-binding protein
MKLKQLSLLLTFALMFSLNSQAASLKGKVAIDGSSTVYPITEAVAEEFRTVHPRVRVTVGVSGTGGGFKKFLAKSIDINDASRNIKSKEMKKAKEKGIDYLEIPVAYDGITIVVNKANTWADEITVAELKKIWQPGSKVVTWKDVRSTWPDKKIKLYGPGTDSGTFDYFTKAINGKERASRANYNMSEDDNVLINGVSGDKYSLGYFGYAYYAENKSQLKAVKISYKGGKAIAPSIKTINDGTYKPLSRSIFIYVNTASLLRKEVKTFVEFYINQAAKLSQEVGYVAMPSKIYKKFLTKVQSK